MKTYSSIGWTKVEKISWLVNASSTEGSPKVTQDGKYFYFGCSRSSINDLQPKPENIAKIEERIQRPGDGSGNFCYLNFSSLPLSQNNSQPKSNEAA